MSQSQLSIFREVNKLAAVLNLTTVSRFALGYFLLSLISKKILKTPVPTIRLEGTYKDIPFIFHIGDRMDVAVLTEIFINGEYIMPFAIQPKVIVDIGANIGTATLFLAHTYPEAVIYSIEADPDIYKRLVANTSHLSRVHCFNIAVGNTDGSITFNKGGSHLGGSIKQRANNVVTITVPAKKLSTFVQEHSISTIDLLKVDIEGAEEDLFADLKTHPEVVINTTAAELHYDLADENSLKTFKNGFETRVIKLLGPERELFYGSKLQED